MSNELSTNFTPASNVINLVILSSVMGNDFAILNHFFKEGSTEPLEPTTFPYL